MHGRDSKLLNDNKLLYRPIYNKHCGGTYASVWYISNKGANLLANQNNRKLWDICLEAGGNPYILSFLLIAEKTNQQLRISKYDL